MCKYIAHRRNSDSKCRAKSIRFNVVKWMNERTSDCNVWVSVNVEEKKWILLCRSRLKDTIELRNKWDTHIRTGKRTTSPPKNVLCVCCRFYCSWLLMVRKQQNNNDNQKDSTKFYTILPVCVCAAHRVFEYCRWVVCEVADAYEIATFIKYLHWRHSFAFRLLFFRNGDVKIVRTITRSHRQTHTCKRVNW